MKKIVSDRIKFLGFLMTCGMVVYHCPILGEEYSLGAWDTQINEMLRGFISSLGTIVMCYFFANTGFLLFRNFELKDYPAKIKRRFFSLLIPYLLWQIVVMLIDILQKQYAFDKVDFLRRTFGLVMWPLDGALWYMYAVFLMALLSPVLLILFKNKKIAWIAIFWLILLVESRQRVSNSVLIEIINYGYVDNILYYLPCYLIGAFYGKFYDENSKVDELVYIVLALAAAWLLEGTFGGIFSKIALKALPIAIIYLLPMYPFLTNRRIYKLTFLIYAMHMPLIGDVWPFICNTLYPKVVMPVFGYNILTRIIILGIDIGLAALIYFVLKRFAPKVLDLLTGGRV